MNKVVFSLLLFLSVKSVATPDASQTCRSWFKDSTQAIGQQMVAEQSWAAALGLPVSSPEELRLQLDLTVQRANYLCDRLSSIADFQISSKGKTLVETCGLTFSDWEDAMDARFTDLIFEKGLLSQIGDYAPAQEIHRREAREGIRMCRILEPQ